MEHRKLAEQRLHDHLRSGGAPLSDISNKKFYSIAALNRAFVDAWLVERCPGRTVLDYCTGNGELAIRCAELGATSWGVDISAVSIANAQRAAQRAGVGGRVNFVVGDAESLSFQSGSFDVVVVNGVLHHLALDRAYAEIARVLKPSGATICTEALRHNPVFHLYRRLTPHLRSAWEVDHILGKKEITLAEKYFETVEVLQFFHLATLLAVPFRGRAVFKPVLNLLQTVDSIALRLPGLKWHAWMAVFAASRPRQN